MAIYGIGATWNNDDMVEEFLRDNKICMGWSIIQAPSIYRILRDIKIGDIIYIKSYEFSQSPAQLRVKAVGIIIDDNLFAYNEESERNNYRECITVRWLWRGNEIIEFNDPYNVRTNSLFQEFNPNIQRIILDLLLTNF